MSANSRRDFLKTAATAALLGSVVPIQGALSPRFLRYYRFAALLDTEFTLFLGDLSSMKLILTEARAGVVEPDFEEFSLRFIGQGTRILSQGTYKFTHKRIMGPFYMFIVPNAGGNGPQYYEVVFNRFLS